MLYSYVSLMRSTLYHERACSWSGTSLRLAISKHGSDNKVDYIYFVDLAHEVQTLFNDRTTITMVTELILGLRPGNERRRYKVTPSLIGWVQTENQPCHQMESFSVLLALCAGNSPVTGEFPAQWPVTRSFSIFFDLCLNKQLSKQSRRCD